jgi:hypothetical protein
MDIRPKTDSGKGHRSSGLSLLFGVSNRRILRIAKKYIAPMGIIVLALSTACAPVTRTAHVSTVTPYSPKDSSQSEFIVNTNSSSLASEESVSSKLEVLFEGQRLSVDTPSYSNDTDTSQSTFNMSADNPVATSDMGSQLLASVASELGIMSELADGGPLLASAASVFGESGSGTPGEDDPPILASLPIWQRL